MTSLTETGASMRRRGLVRKDVLFQAEFKEIPDNHVQLTTELIIFRLKKDAGKD